MRRPRGKRERIRDREGDSTSTLIVRIVMTLLSCKTAMLYEET